jgi:hypothetical protein
MATKTKKKTTKKKVFTVKDLDSLLAKIEGKKSQTSIGNIREIRKALFSLILTDMRVYNLVNKAMWDSYDTWVVKKSKKRSKPKGTLV